MNLRESLQSLLVATALLIATTLFGIVGFHITEGYGWVDSIYMTVITMSTVGYGTIGELSPGGKIFSVLLIATSAGTFIYAVTTITTFVVEGEIQFLLNRYQSSKKVAKLTDHIIICGLGRNGREAARELIRQKRPFVVIESNEEVIETFIREEAKILSVKGDATHEEILEEANIRKARGLVSALSTDAENVFIALTAREMNPKLTIIARATHESVIHKLKRAGADEVIIPNQIGGKKMANLITRPALVEFMELISGEGDPQLHLEQVDCSKSNKLVGNTLASLGIRAKTGVLVLGMKRGNKHVNLNPSSDLEIAESDNLFIIGTDQQLALFKQRYLN